MTLTTVASGDAKSDGEGDSRASMAARLAEPELIKLVERVVRKRVPASDAPDVVQIVLCDALEAPAIPEEPEELRKWLVGIARHKIADHFRRGGRARLVELDDNVAEPNDVEAHSARDLGDWAERQVGADPNDKRTLEWMAREGEGDKLAHIAEDAKVPATMVRQRVSRLRRLLREKWAAELAAVAAVFGLALFLWSRLSGEGPVAEHTPPADPSSVAPDSRVAERLLEAGRLRRDGLAACNEQRWSTCLGKLDDAARLDAVGDEASEVQAARRRATDALATPLPDPSPAPSATATPAPSGTAIPAPPSDPTTTPPAPRSTSAKPTPPRAPSDSKSMELEPKLWGTSESGPPVEKPSPPPQQQRDGGDFSGNKAPSKMKKMK